MFESGIDPVVSGLAVGLATSAYPPSREDLEQATALARSFREQPTPELARSAQQGVLAAISPNERLQYMLHPWTSYVIVPLFALANAGVHVTGGLLEDAISSPITLGILIGYLVGKPVGIAGASLLASRPALHGPRSPLSPPLLAAGGAFAGVGFTVSLLIASLAFEGRQLEEAKLGALGLRDPRADRRLDGTAHRQATAEHVRARQIAETAEDILDLSEEVDPQRDHIRGPRDALVTLVEYGDFECPYCGQAEGVIRELLADFGDELRYVWRHLPLNDVHSQRAARGRGLGGRRRAGHASGRCTTCCSATRASCDPMTSWPTQSSWDWTPSGSPTSCAAACTRHGSARTWPAPTKAASPARRPSSSTGAGTTAPTTSTRSPPSYGQRATGRR